MHVAFSDIAWPCTGSNLFSIYCTDDIHLALGLWASSAATIGLEAGFQLEVIYYKIQHVLHDAF